MCLTSGTTIALFAALVGLQIYHRNYMCIFCAFFLNIGKEAFQLLSEIFLFLSLLMITTKWIGLVYQIYLMAINNIFPLRWNTFHGWQDEVGSLESGRVANFKFMPDATQMAMRNLDSQGISTL